MPKRVAILFLVAVSAPAQAEPGSQTISVGVGYSTFSIPDHSPDGTMLGVDYELGLADVVMLRVSAGGGMYFADERSYSAQGVVGLTYQVDVLRLVPYGSVAAGGIVLGGGGIDTDIFGLLELAVGLDFRHSRHFSYGVQIRSETYVESTSFFAVSARVSWRL